MTPDSLAVIKEHFGVREWGLQAPLAVRVLRRLVETDSGCWIWTGATARGYGIVATRTGATANTYTHRALYQLLVGPIPADRPQIDHLCRVTRCARPSHLEPVTASQNMQRGWDARRAEVCDQGHPYDYDWHGQRRCRTCKAEYDRARRASRRLAGVA